MTLEDINYAAQTIGVFLVLGSLIALYFQGRQTHSVELSSGQRDLLAQAREHLAVLRHDEQLFNAVTECLEKLWGRFTHCRSVSARAQGTSSGDT